MARCSLRSTTRTIGTFRAKHFVERVSLQRALSTSNNATANLSDTDTVIPLRQEPLTLLHKTSKIVPQVLGYRPVALCGKTALKLETWEKILADIFEDLSSTSRRPIRLAVHGVDGWSGSEDFVTALLSNPLESNEAQSRALKDRWTQTSAESITISYGPKARVEESTLELAAPYLQRFPAPIEVIELRSSISTQKPKAPLGDKTLQQLFEADIPILLCNPLATSIQSLLSTPLPSNTIIIITSTPSQTIDLDHLLSYVPEHSPKPTLLIVDPKRASDAVGLIQSNPTSSLVVQSFQDAFNGSNISAVTRALEVLLGRPAEPSNQATRTTGSLQSELALRRLRDALSQCLGSLAEIRRRLDSASIDASHLNDKLEEARAKAEHEFLGPAQPSSSSSPPSTSKVRHNEVAEAIRSAESQMKSIMSRFTWWRMILRVDEVTALITAALQKTWCPELERKLLIHTGQLYAIQNELTKDSFKLLSEHRVVPTNVLRNSLMQLTASPQDRSNVLTYPISSRRNQIIEYPTARLHVSAQRAVLGMTGGIVGGAGLGWVGWMGWLVGSGEGLLGSLGLEPTTAMGIGALSAVASVRWAVGRWEKGKKKWWEDWRRVGDGLDRDLRTTLDNYMQQQVGGVARATAKGLAQLIAQRESEVAKLNEEVQRLAVEVDRAVKGHGPDTN